MRLKKSVNVSKVVMDHPNQLSSPAKAGYPTERRQRICAISVGFNELMKNSVSPPL